MKIFKIIVPAISALFAASFSLHADVPTGYYKSLEGKSGKELKKAVKEVAIDHKVIDYGEDMWEVFKSTDSRTVQGEPIWWDMYSSERVKVAYGHDAMNIEHSVANSWWGGVKNDAYKDLFHLNPANALANNQKSNYPLGEVASVTWTNGITTIGTPASGMGGGASRVYEPADFYKGDFARAFFYVFTVYDDLNWRDETAWMYDTSSDLLLQPWAYEMLLRWSEEDPVSVKEYNRNEMIYAVQHNRNPYIDCSNLASHIWGKDNTKGFTYLGAYEPVPDPDLGDDEEDDKPALKGKWVAVVSADQLNENDRYCIVETSGYHAMSATYDKSKKYIAASSILPEIDIDTKPWTISAMPEDMAEVTLKAVNGGYSIGVATAEGNFLGYLKSTAAKSVSFSTTPGGDGCVAKITPGRDETVIDFGNAGKLQYNKQNPRFVTYASNQQSLQLFRYVGQEDTPSGIDNLREEEMLRQIVKIYDINGRQIKSANIDDLAPGLYILITPGGAIKFMK